MVSLGTILSLGIIGAVAVGGYALYRNADKVGGALSRGIETNITYPIGNYFDNLWQGVKVPTVSPPPAPTTQAPQYIPVSQPGAGQPNPANAPTHSSPTDKILSQGGTPTPSPQEILTDPNVNLEKFQPPQPSEGWYYINYKGSKYDTQWYLTKEQAAKTMQTAQASPTDYFENIKFLGSAKLSDRSFHLIGQANQYL